MNKLGRVGIDLAKNVFQLHGVDRHGKAAWRPLSSGVQVVDADRVRQTVAVRGSSSRECDTAWPISTHRVRIAPPHRHHARSSRESSSSW